MFGMRDQQLLRRMRGRSGMRGRRQLLRCGGALGSQAKHRSQHN
jgi:hypothetical protein